MSDQNEISKIQEHLIKSEKMANLGALVAGFAHEISTPIGLGVTGMSHFMSETRKLRKLFDSQEMTQKDFERYLNDAEKTADIVYTNLISSKNIIQSFKRVSVDQSSEAKREFNLYEYIDEIILSLHNKLKHTNIEVQNRVDREIDLDSYAGSFAQIFTNLIMNSLIHGFTQNEVGTITISAKESSKGIEINYRDNGMGISTENIERIYEPFFTTKADDGGSGLGMQIIHRLVTEHLKGDIGVKSILGEGVSFSMIIPKEIV